MRLLKVGPCGPAGLIEKRRRHVEGTGDLAHLFAPNFRELGIGQLQGDLLEGHAFVKNGGLARLFPAMGVEPRGDNLLLRFGIQLVGPKDHARGTAPIFEEPRKVSFGGKAKANGLTGQRDRRQAPQPLDVQNVMVRQHHVPATLQLHLVGRFAKVVIFDTDGGGVHPVQFHRAPFYAHHLRKAVAGQQGIGG